WTAGALGGLAAGLIDRPRPAAAAGELDFLFPGGTWKEYFERIYTAPFAKEKGVQVVFSVGDVAQQMSRVIAERQNERFDLFHVHQYLAAQLADLDLVVPPDPRIVTNLGDVDPAFRFPGFVGKVLAPFGLTYNIKKSGKKVASWTDLWDPAFAGRVAIPKWDWVGNTWFYAVNRVWGGTEENVDPGMAKCRELVKKSRAIVMNSVAHGLNLFQTEEILIAPFHTARTEQANQAVLLTPAQMANLGKLRFDVKTMLLRRDSHAERWNKEVLAS